MTDLKGKTLFITGATRGIGYAIAEKAAKDGANIAIMQKQQNLIQNYLELFIQLLRISLRQVEMQLV